jgi:excisionase family DNA binding protein
MSTPQSARLLTVKEAADFARVAPQTVYRWITESRVPSIRVGNAIRIPRRWMDQLIAQAEREAGSAGAVGGEPA